MELFSRLNFVLIWLKKDCLSLCSFMDFYIWWFMGRISQPPLALLVYFFTFCIKSPQKSALLQMGVSTVSGHHRRTPAWVRRGSDTLNCSILQYLYFHQRATLSTRKPCERGLWCEDDCKGSGMKFTYSFSSNHSVISRVPYESITFIYDCPLVQVLTLVNGV